MIKTCKLSGVTLDIYIAHIYGIKFKIQKSDNHLILWCDPFTGVIYSPSTISNQFLHIWTRERLMIVPADTLFGSSDEWSAQYPDWVKKGIFCYGPNQKIAAMRAVVFDRYGEEVPEIML